MKKDTMNEMLTGHKGAFRVIGKVVTYDAPGRIGREPMTVVFGMFVDNINEPLTGKDKDEAMSKSLNFQMWEGEFIFLPHRVYQGRKETAENFNGMRVDQMMTSTWGHAEKWLRKIFDKDETKTTKPSKKQA